MSNPRVHELAKEVGKQNKEIIEFLKQKGMDVKSHMSSVGEPYITMVKQQYTISGKEHKKTLDTPRTEEKVITAKAEGDKAETPKKKKNIIRVYHAQNASDAGKGRKKPAGERRGTARPQAKTAPADKPKTAETPVKPASPEQSRPASAERRPSDRAERRPADNAGRQTERRADGQQSRDNRGGSDRRGQQGERSQRSGAGRQQGERSQRPGGARQGDRPQRQGEGGQRFQRSGDGNRAPRGGQGENRQGRFGQNRPQGGPQQGRTEGSRGGDGRFQGNRTGGQRSNTRKNDNDMVFAPELTKTSKDSKRERDRENKNKKKDFDKTQSTGRRPNQGGSRQNSRLPKALQKPTPAPKQEEKKPEVKEITLPEKMTIRELAEAMKMQPSAIVKKLFMQGVMVTVNHEIDFEKAQEIALEYDIIAEPEEKVDVIGELLKEDEEDESTMIPRPPVVCVMGHVDHGKTSLLDAIRNTNVTRGEAGGITQHIGAYVVTINDQKITFLDTPGHEAFTAMRMRGANATDIAVLVVAADDGVMPQTVEAISHAKAAGVEIIVAINKIDKPSANVERVKQELSEYELIPEDWGGSTIFVPVSAHTGEGIDTLLEMILLTAEVSELKANPKRAARGLVIEAQLDKGKGPVATILVQ